ncbi:unnamed protein product [Nezara viridula]|uniref:Lysosome-associated membrane glycoprotein 5 n=1 Tax=Nezara viridula TaxID=85310 RepID=A0A9P0E7M0_NEZVI|nr:unnamed protein product [Nezara viridula]
MFIKYIFLFSLFIGFILADESSNKVNDGKDVEMPVKTVTIKEVELKETTISKPSPTPKPTSTPAPSTTSHTSTTTLPPSSSVSPPSTIPSTTMSTPAPPTTPSPTSPSTTPTPVPPEFWTVTNSTSNITCIVARMNIKLEMHHENKSLILKGTPQTLEANGECGKDLQTLQIFLPQNGSNSATVLFNFTETEKTYFISSLSIMIPLNSSDKVYETRNVTLYETGKNTSYSCPSYMLNLEPDNRTTVRLSMGNIQVEAFRFSNTTKFSQAVQCPNNEVPDIVPLIVGLALAGLVIVVVIGYFIGRRRSQARGYLSM